MAKTKAQGKTKKDEMTTEVTQLGGRRVNLKIHDPGIGDYEFNLGPPKLKHRKMIAKLIGASRKGGTQKKYERIAKNHGISLEELQDYDPDKLTPEEQQILENDKTIENTVSVFAEAIYATFQSGDFSAYDEEAKSLRTPVPIVVGSLEDVEEIDFGISTAIFKESMKIINKSFVTGGNRKN